MVQWLIIHIAMQGTQVQSLVGELKSRILWGKKAHVPQLETAWVLQLKVLCAATRTDAAK